MDRGGHWIFQSRHLGREKPSRLRLLAASKRGGLPAPDRPPPSSNGGGGSGGKRKHWMVGGHRDDRHQKLVWRDGALFEGGEMIAPEVRGKINSLGEAEEASEEAAIHLRPTRRYWRSSASFYKVEAKVLLL